MNKKGFTLIELLVVIAILGILSTIAVVSLQSAREKGRDAKRVSDIKQIQTALELYYNDSAEYPSGNAITLGDTQYKVLSSEGFEGSLTTDATLYIASIPADPLTSQSYVYTNTESGASYTIAYTLEGSTGDLEAGAHIATPAGISDGTPEAAE